MDPTTAQVETPVEQTETQPNAGFQARIDELTKGMREAQQRADEATRSMMEMAAKVTAAQTPVQTPAPDPMQAHRGELDPRLVEILEHQQKQFQMALAAKTQHFEIEMGKAQIAQMAAAAPGIKPEVYAQAVQVYEQSRRNGSNPTPEEALLHVLGKATLAQMQRAAPVMGVSPQAFNSPFATLPPTAPPPVAGPTLPGNIDELPLDQQLALYEKAGFGNQPL